MTLTTLLEESLTHVATSLTLAQSIRRSLHSPEHLWRASIQFSATRPRST